MNFQDPKASSVPSARVYLEPLDGLRFFAFLLVLLHHVNPPPSLRVPYAMYTIGWAGVDLFVDFHPEVIHLAR